MMAAYLTDHDGTFYVHAYDDGRLLLRREMGSRHAWAMTGEPINVILRQAQGVLTAEGFTTSGPWTDAPGPAIDYKIAVSR